MRVLVIEDDRDVAGFVLKGLREAGHVAEHADNGRDGLFMAAGEPFDAIILDRMLPGGIDGLRVLETLRGQDNHTPVLFLSAMAQVDDRLHSVNSLHASRRWPVEGGMPAQRRNWSSANLRWICCPDPFAGKDRRSTFSRGSSGCSSILCGMPARSSLAPCCSKAYGTITLIPRQTSSTCM